MKIQITLVAIVAYCISLSSSIEAFGSGSGRLGQIRKRETSHLEKIFHFIGYRDAPGKHNIGAELSMKSIEECAQHMVDNNYKFGVWFMEASKCQPKSVVEGNEILCSCGNHVGNYTIDSHTIETKKVTSLEQTQADIKNWLDQGTCDMIEKTKTETRCKKFEPNLDGVMLFKKEN